MELVFLSTLSLRRATRNVSHFFKPNKNFYPRSPCGERLRIPAFLPADRIFLSTLSLRRATLQSLLLKVGIFYFYPRSPCGERQLLHGSESKGIKISIHALLAESDTDIIGHTCNISAFLSTLSLRRATNFGLPCILSYSISIHALLAESDN